MDSEMEESVSFNHPGSYGSEDAEMAEYEKQQQMKEEEEALNEWHEPKIIDSTEEEFIRERRRLMRVHPPASITEKKDGEETNVDVFVLNSKGESIKKVIHVTPEIVSTLARAEAVSEERKQELASQIVKLLASNSDNKKDLLTIIDKSGVERIADLNVLEDLELLASQNNVYLPLSVFNNNNNNNRSEQAEDMIRLDPESLPFKVFQYPLLDPISLSMIQKHLILDNDLTLYFKPILNTPVKVTNLYLFLTGKASERMVDAFFLLNFYRAFIKHLRSMLFTKEDGSKKLIDLHNAFNVMLAEGNPYLDIYYVFELMSRNEPVFVDGGEAETLMAEIREYITITGEDIPYTDEKAQGFVKRFVAILKNLAEKHSDIAITWFYDMDTVKEMRKVLDEMTVDVNAMLKKRLDELIEYDTNKNNSAPLSESKDLMKTNVPFSVYNLAPVLFVTTTNVDVMDCILKLHEKAIFLLLKRKIIEQATLHSKNKSAATNKRKEEDNREEHPEYIIPPNHWGKMCSSVGVPNIPNYTYPESLNKNIIKARNKTMAVREEAMKKKIEQKSDNLSNNNNSLYPDKMEGTEEASSPHPPETGKADERDAWMPIPSEIDAFMKFVYYLKSLEDDESYASELEAVNKMGEYLEKVYIEEANRVKAIEAAAAQKHEDIKRRLQETDEKKRTGEVTIEEITE